MKSLGQLCDTISQYVNNNTNMINYLQYEMIII